MSKQYILQARPRFMANVKKADGENYDPAMIAAQYKNTPHVETTASKGRQLLEDARADRLKAWPTKAFKFRIKRVDLDALAQVEAETVGAT